MAKLITAAEVINLAFNRKVNHEKITESVIQAAQYKYIRPVLGDDLYDAILDDVNAAAYTTLTPYIKQALAWWTKYLALPELFVEITDTGVKQIQGENSVNVTDQRFIELRENIRTIAETKLKELTEFLYDNQSDYSDYYHGKNVDAEITIAGGIIMEETNVVDLTDDDDPWNDGL